MNQITLLNPIDRHSHWRDIDNLMPVVAPYSMRQFQVGLLMPNTSPFIENWRTLEKYRGDVFRVIGKNNFCPLFTMYLSKNLTEIDLLNAWAHDWINGVKYYPKGGTTNSEGGLEGFEQVRHLLKRMEREGIPLHIHGEVPEINGEVVDDFYREAIFLKTELALLVKEFPNLKIILEHITTAEAVDFVLAHKNIIATITPQHILFDRRVLYNGVKMNGRSFKFITNPGNGTHADYMCRPIPKEIKDVMAIRNALFRQAKEGFKKFFLGSDSAPWLKEKKYCACGSCGVYSAPTVLELYAMGLEMIGILDHFQIFACEPMPEYYRIPKDLPDKIVTIKPVEQTIQTEYENIVTPFAGLTIPWSVQYES